MDVNKEIKQYYKYLKDISEHHASISRKLYQNRGSDELKLREAIWHDGISRGHAADTLAFMAMFRGVLNDDKGSRLPSTFTTLPSDSVLQKTEAEIVAVNIMVILKRTGNKFRDLSWEEYKSERMKDKEFSQDEYQYFQRVIGYCKTADTARLFSKKWEQ